MGRNIAKSLFDPNSDLSDIGRAMNWLRLGAPSRPSSGRFVFDSRDTLSKSIVRQVEKRREDGRLAIAGKRAGMAQQDWILVNTSEGGMAIRVWGRAPFARGEKYVVSIRAGALRVEVEGRVCWTRSSWHRDLLGGDRKAYCQTAGFAVGEGLTAEQESGWQTLREMAEERSVRLVIGLVSQHREPRRDGVVVPFRLRAASS
jgi:hypothetical protein